jgi:hypothetical protein
VTTPADTAPAPTPDTPADTAATSTDTEPVDLAAEAEKWKALAQKHEQRAKANASAAQELEKFKQQSMTDAEKAVAEAEKRGQQQAADRYASRLVDEAFRAATVGRVLTPDALLSFDRKQFITDDGDVDRDGLAKWIEQHAPEQGAPRVPSFDGGPRSTPPASEGMNGLIRKATGRA